MASTNQISGLSSGFDWRSMVDQLMAIEKRPVDLIEKQKTQYETQLTEWRSFNTQLLSLKTAAEALSKPVNFNTFSSSMTSDNADIDAEDLLSVSTNSHAEKGTYTITINNIATAQKIGSASFASGTNDLGSGYNGDIIINGKTITISETDGLDDVRNKINGADAGVTASLIRYSDTDYRLNLTSDDTGAEGISLENGSATDILQALGWTDSEGVVNEIVVGKDASFLLDGVAVTSADNNIDDVLTGVTFKLTGDDAATTITLNIERDTSAIENKIKTFVDAYNEVSSYINKQQTYNKENETTGGVLFGDGTLSSIKSDLTSLLVDPVWGVSSKFSIMGLAGIHLDSNNQLSIDSEELGGYLESNFSDIQKLFSVNGTSTSGSIEYVYSTNSTKSGNYAVNITQTAAKASSDPSSAISGNLGSDQTLTISSGENIATVSLTSDMTISDIVTAINSEMDTEYTEKLVGDNDVQSGGAAVTSSTTWAAIDGATLSDGSSISFTGTSRDGSSVSGSYTIASTATDTIQGLLTEIESAFGNNISASIDINGRLVLTDDEEGANELSFSFDQNGSDIFGTVLTTNGDGQEGRSAMAIGASDDGSGHLVLSSDYYGSGNSFTIDSSLWAGSPVTVNNGQDVAGTINGEAATGKGQTLTGVKDAANIAGLSINYTGSTTGNVGNIKFTAGVAELFERALYNITDSIDGYVANKIDSLSNQIDNKDELIDNVNARLDRKMDAMISRFVAMELALSKLQSQSQWLSGQITALFS